LAAVAADARGVVDELERAVVGKRAALELIVSGLLADGHVLLEDNPGTAKTLIVRSLATVTGLAFARIQFTPDLMPADVTGSTVFDQRNGEFEFRPGPVFANLVLADEINRTPPKTQAALLEAMQEHQVTVDGTTHPLSRPFLVVATENPIEWEGTYPLPEAQLDRFLLRTSIGYPDVDDEREILDRRLARRRDEVELRPRIDTDRLLAMQQAVEQIHVADDLVDYVVRIVDATRTSNQLQVGASPRGSLALVKLARARAVLHGRDYVVPDDVKSLARPALAHRLVLRSELWVRRIRPETVLDGIVAAVPAPTIT